MGSIAVANWTINSTDAAAPDSNACFLTHVLNNTATSSINAIKTIVSFNKHTTTKLTLRRTDTSHYRSRQTNIMQTNSIVVLFNPL